MKSHGTDGVSLIFGVIFLGIGGYHLLGRTARLDVPQIGWFVAGGLILIGLLGLAGALRGSRDAGARAPVAATPGGPPAPTMPGGATDSASTVELGGTGEPGDTGHGGGERPAAGP